MNNSDKYELIDNVLSNQLSESDKLIFDELVTSDPNFLKEVEKVRVANKAIHQLGLFETSNKLNALHKKQVKIKTRQRYLSFGAVTILLIGLASYGFYQINSVEKRTSFIPHSLEVTREKTVIDKQHQITSKSSINKSITNTKNPQEEQSPHKESDLYIKDTTKTLEIKKAIDFSEINEIPSVVIDTFTNSDTMEIQILPKASIKKKICGDILLSNYNTKPSCIGEQNGAIIFSEKALIGGFLPYKTYIYKLNEEENYLYKDQLSFGQYFIKVIDANGCVDTISNIFITEQRCLKRINESFSPIYGESWEYPKIKGVSEYTVFIKDKANILILEKDVFLNEETDWNGYLDNGTMIKKGIYFIEIKYQQETYFVGSITII